MLTIRNSQIQSLQQSMDNDFIKKLAGDIRLHHAEQTKEITDERLHKMVEHGVAKARRYELTEKYPIAMFVELMFMVGPDFDEYPPVQFILKDEQIMPNARIDRILDTMTEQQWKNAKRRSNQDAWQV